MSQEDKYVKIIEGLAELKGTTVAIQTDIKILKEDSRKNTKDLEKHISGVNTNTARLDIEIETRQHVIEQIEAQSQEKFSKIDTRLEEIEFLPDLIKKLGKALKWLGGLAASGLVISKFLGLW